ncbi:MAG: hypothetical protein HN366_04660 [Deltaproteobacteria bacterium]|mgnify:CR=1 FL=1|nr:hypothetical protein [Deltaproteobacteria bacterium]
MQNIRTILAGLMLCLFIFGISPCSVIAEADAGDHHAVLFMVTGLAGANPYVAKGSQYSARVLNKIDHFCVIKVTPKTLDITAYDNENQVLDHVGLSNPAVVATLAESAEKREEFVRSGMVWEEPIAGR